MPFTKHFHMWPNLIFTIILDTIIPIVCWETVFSKQSIGLNNWFEYLTQSHITDCCHSNWSQVLNPVVFPLLPVDTYRHQILTFPKQYYS